MTDESNPDLAHTPEKDQERIFNDLYFLELQWFEDQTRYDLKFIVSTYQPACAALQKTFLKSTMTMRVRGYNCVRRDVNVNASPNGGVGLFPSHLYPSNVVTRHTSLQVVAVWIHIHTLVSVCCIYLPPNNVVPQVDFNQLVSQLPVPFVLLGEFNGHSPLWGNDDSNRAVDNEVLNVTEDIHNAAVAAIPKTSNSTPKQGRS
ncbi:RNA-directed DNA polymerase from mobile element jockey [Trichonephila clavipes]|nr:RNA-directed DNA polymerase from mobile element jockey [Trichonephila clavipes]